MNIPEYNNYEIDLRPQNSDNLKNKECDKAYALNLQESLESPYMIDVVDRPDYIYGLTRSQKTYGEPYDMEYSKEPVPSQETIFSRTEFTSQLDDGDISFIEYMSSQAPDNSLEETFVKAKDSFELLISTSITENDGNPDEESDNSYEFMNPFYISLSSICEESFNGSLVLKEMIFPKKDMYGRDLRTYPYLTLFVNDGIESWKSDRIVSTNKSTEDSFGLIMFINTEDEKQYIHWKNPDSNQLFIKENFQNETDTLKFTLCSPNGEIIDFVREDKICKNSITYIFSYTKNKTIAVENNSFSPNGPMLETNYAV
jgi:hypothetical protein